MAEGVGLLHARAGDRADRGGGDCHYRCGGVPADENALQEGCGWREGQGCQDCWCQEDCYQDCEGLACLFERDYRDEGVSLLPRQGKSI